jgi:anti-sigma B factor antagonist
MSEAVDRRRAADGKRPPLRWRLDTEAGDAVLWLDGEIDYESIATLAEALSTSRLDAPLVVDLTGVDFCDASGLRVLLAAQAFFGRSGHVLSLRSPSRPVRRLLEFTDTGATFPIIDGRVDDDARR